jgi:hypothetical protein
MLVSFHKGFIMEGENTVTERKHFWSKPESRRHKIYCTTGIYGICDDSELDTVVEEQIQKRLAGSGWGKDFSGWQRVLTYEESLEIGKQNGWFEGMFGSTPEDLPKCKLTTKTLDNWTVERAAKELNGRQFAQYCRDFGIPCYNK